MPTGNSQLKMEDRIMEIDGESADASIPLQIIQPCNEDTASATKTTPDFLDISAQPDIGEDFRPVPKRSKFRTVTVVAALYVRNLNLCNSKLTINCAPLLWQL
jgi:hypothetical protein